MRAGKLAKCALISISLIVAIIIGWGAFIGIASYRMYSSYNYLRQSHQHDNHLVNDLMATCLDHDMHTFFGMKGYFEQSDTHLAEPTYSDENIVAWTTNSLTQAMNLNHLDIKQQLLKGRRYFTLDGWCHFIDALASANIIDAIVTRKLNINIVLNGTPKLTEGSVKDGVYSWTMEAPVSIVFKADDEVTTPPNVTNETLVVRISRSPPATNRDGIGISQWVAFSVS
jgi:hypothetical protein